MATVEAAVVPTAMAAAMVPTAMLPTVMAAAMVPTAVVPTAMAVAMVATAMAPTAGDPYDHGGHGGASYEAVSVEQSPGGGGGGYDIPSRPPVAPDHGYH